MFVKEFIRKDYLVNFFCRYLAAKVYYFGVQGGIRQFEEYLHRTGLFQSRVIRTIDASKTQSFIPMQVNLIRLFRCETRNFGNNPCLMKIFY